MSKQLSFQNSIYRTGLSMVLFYFLLAACQPQPEKVSFMVFGDPAELAAYQQIAGAFMKQHPEVAVEVVHIPSQDDYRKRVAADLAAGTPADVVLFNYRRYAEFAVKGALEPLDAYLEQSELLDEADFYPQAWEPFRYRGQVMCIPQNISSLVVYYNKDLFDQAGVEYPQAGWNWEDFLQTAQALTLDTDGDGQTDQFGLGVEPELLRLAPFIWQAQGELVDDDAQMTDLLVDMPQSYDAYFYFTRLQTEWHVVPNAEQYAAQDSETRFQNGTLGMYLNSRRIVPTLREAAAFDWDVGPLPQKDVAASVLHADGYCLPSASKVKEAAWKLIEFANSEEGQELIAATGRTVPSRMAVAQSQAFLNPNQKPARSQVFLDVIPNIRAVPVDPRWAELEKIASEELSRAFYGQASVPDAVVATMLRAEEVFATQPAP